MSANAESDLQKVCLLLATALATSVKCSIFLFPFLYCRVEGCHHKSVPPSVMWCNHLDYHRDFVWSKTLNSTATVTVEAGVLPEIVKF